MTPDDLDDGPDLSDYDPNWSMSTPAERAAALKAEVAETMAFKRRARRREARRQIATIKAAIKAGLTIKRAIIDGVAMEIGAAETMPRAGTPFSPEPAPADDVNPWDEDLGTIPLPLRQ
jgi:hypothetical protein